jgi:hypothetical protein
MKKEISKSRSRPSNGSLVVYVNQTADGTEASRQQTADQTRPDQTTKEAHKEAPRRVAGGPAESTKGGR